MAFHGRVQAICISRIYFMLSEFILKQIAAACKITPLINEIFIS